MLADESVKKRWSRSGQGDNRDRTRLDHFAESQDPIRRYEHTRELRRKEPTEKVKIWDMRARHTQPVPCQLCQNTEFICKGDWLEHVNKEHGGEQRYRNALFALESLCPHKTIGQEMRLIIGNFTEFYTRGAMGWGGFSEEMTAQANSDE